MKSFYRENVDIFGFEAKEPKCQTKPEDELPIRHFALDRLMDNLARFPVGEMSIRRPFDDQIQWGDNDGAIRARLTPNIGITIERMTTDLRGRPIWITKKLYKIKSGEYAGYEDSVAQELSQHIQDISKEPVDSPTAEYNGLYNIVKRLSDKVRVEGNRIFSFQEVKKVNDHNYNILLSIANYGQGKLVGRLKPSPASGGILDMSYDKDSGMIKGILTTIEVEDSGAWELDVPYFMGNFAPSQGLEEIATNMISGLRHI